MRYRNALLAIACLFLTVQAEADDRDAITALESNGANVQRDETQQQRPLRHVTYNLRQVTVEGILALKAIEELPSIEFLGTGDTSITVETLQALQGKKHLKRFAISHAKISDEAATILGTIRSLDVLNLQAQNDISPTGLEEIFRLTNLKELTLSDRLVNDEVLADLTKLPALKTLNVRSVFVTDQGLASLRQLKNLQTLRVFLGTEITAEGMRHLSELRLKELEITYLNPNDAVIKQLRKVSSLKTLHLLNAKNVTEHAIPFFVDMTELKELEIIGVKISPEGIKELKRALPGCKISLGTL